LIWFRGERQGRSSTDGRTQTAVILTSGITIGLFAALFSARLLRGMLFGIKPHDPATIAAAVGLLCGVGLLPGYLSARRA
jgi:hypothetical protein